MLVIKNWLPEFITTWETQLDTFIMRKNRYVNIYDGDGIKFANFLENNMHINDWMNK